MDVNIEQWYETERKTPSDQIHSSPTVTEELDQRRFDGETYNDVLERTLSETAEINSQEQFGAPSENRVISPRGPSEKRWKWPRVKRIIQQRLRDRIW